MARITVWLFGIALGIDLGAGLYESRIVVPLWSQGVPGTLADGNPFARVAIDAGMRFWAFVTPAVGLCAVAALVFGNACRSRSASGSRSPAASNSACSPRRCSISERH